MAAVSISAGGSVYQLYGLAHGKWRDGRPVQAAIGDGFADVLELDGGRGGEIGDGARYLEYAVVGARRQPEPFHRLFQQLGRVFFEAAYLIDLARGQRLIEAAAAFHLPVPRRRHPRPNRRAVGRSGVRREGMRVGGSRARGKEV